MKLIRRLLGIIFSLVVVCAITLVAGYFIIKNAYGIDLLNSYNQLKVLNEEVDETKLITNPYSNDDLISMKETINSKTNGFISTDDNGKVIINFDKLNLFNSNIELTDRQVAAYANEAIRQEMDNKIEVGDYTFNLELKQIDFSDIKDNGDTLFNVIIKLDLSSLEPTLKKFPYSLIKNYIPNYLYISSNVNVNKTEEPFKYELVSNYLTLNNVDKEGSKELVNALDKIFKIGNYDNLNIKISNEVLLNLIGDDEHNGLAYSLKKAGAKDYTFKTINNEDYFVIKTLLG